MRSLSARVCCFHSAAIHLHVAAGANKAADAAEHVVHAVADNRKQDGFCKRLLLEFTNRFTTDAGKKRNTGLPAYNGRITMTLEQRWRRACNEMRSCGRWHEIGSTMHKEQHRLHAAPYAKSSSLPAAADGDDDVPSSRRRRSSSSLGCWGALAAASCAVQ